MKSLQRAKARKGKQATAEKLKAKKAKGRARTQVGAAIFLHSISSFHTDMSDGIAYTCFRCRTRKLARKVVKKAGNQVLPLVMVFYGILHVPRCR